MATIICADCRKTSLIDNVKGRCGTCYSRCLRSTKRTKSLACEVCKFGFQSARRDARFCSDACRQWSYRERRLLRMGVGNLGKPSQPPIQFATFAYSIMKFFYRKRAQAPPAMQCMLSKPAFVVGCFNPQIVLQAAGLI